MNPIPATLISLTGLMLLGCVVCAGIPKESDPVVESLVRNDVNARGK